MKKMLIAVLIAAAVASAQVKVTSIEKLPLPAGKEWSNPVFSSDGQAIYFTTSSYNGIWKYSRTENSITEITLDPSSGNGFTVSSDGSQIAYRRTTYDVETHERMQTGIVVNIATLSKHVVASGSDVSVPVFVQNTAISSVKGSMAIQGLAKTAATAVEVLGIEDTKIALVKNGGKVLLDPIGSGSYIWPSLSPDRRALVVYDMSHGTFICDLNGNIESRFGRRDAAVWMRDGNGLVYMNDNDDGRSIVSSDICFISRDGKTTQQLTSTPDVLEMNPSCSPVENKIVCSGNGALYVISYEEAK